MKLALERRSAKNVTLISSLVRHRYQVIIDGRLKYPKFLIKEKNRSIGDLVRISG